LVRGDDFTLAPCDPAAIEIDDDRFPPFPRRIGPCLTEMKAYDQLAGGGLVDDADAFRGTEGDLPDQRSIGREEAKRALLSRADDGDAAVGQDLRRQEAPALSRN
jgi:hypothetical protein